MSTKSIKACFRFAAYRLVSIGLGARSGRLPLARFRRVLVVAPHPDDESLGCGGTIAELTAGGAQVWIAVVTDGRASHPGHPNHSPGQIAAMRRLEMGEAARHLGVETGHLHFLDYEDGTLARLPTKARGRLVNDLERLIRSLDPDTILTPCRRDGSSEHDRATECVSEALGRSDRRTRLLEYPIWARWQVRPLIRAFFHYRKVYRVRLGVGLSPKQRAIDAHASQLLPLPPFRDPALPADFRALFDGAHELFFEA